jgi:hypothetical protein
MAATLWDKLKTTHTFQKEYKNSQYVVSSTKDGYLAVYDIMKDKHPSVKKN